jgi:hypothetical protein
MIDINNKNKGFLKCEKCLFEIHVNNIEQSPRDCMNNKINHFYDTKIEY